MLSSKWAPQKKEHGDLNVNMAVSWSLENQDKPRQGAAPDKVMCLRHCLPAQLHVLMEWSSQRALSQ